MGQILRDAYQFSQTSPNAGFAMFILGGLAIVGVVSAVISFFNALGELGRRRPR